MPKSVATWIILIGLGIATASAQLPQKFEFQTGEAMMKGKPHHAMVTPEGWITAGPSLRKIFELPETQIYCLESDGKASYVGTGPEGRLYKISAQGEHTLMIDSPEHTILSIWISKNQGLYAGTGPSGIIYYIRNEKQWETLVKTNEKYVWGIAGTEAGDLYAVTGSPGKVLKIKPDGSFTVLFESKEEHLLQIVRDGDSFLIGSSGSGLVYRLDRDDAVVPIFQADQNEISEIVVHKDYILIAAITAKTGQPQVDTGLDAVYKLDRQGAIEVIWENKDASIFTLASYEQDSWLLGTGDKGNLNLLTSSGELSLLAKDLGGSISDAVSRGDSFVLALFHPATVYELADDRKEASWYESEVIDAGSTATWGSLRAEFSASAPPAVQFKCRSGFTKEVTEHWSPWSQVAEHTLAVTCPPARFIQWAVDLPRLPNDQIAVRKVAITYTLPNHRPLLREIIIYPPSKGVYDRLAPAPMKVFFQDLPGGVRLQYNLNENEPAGLTKGRWLQLREMRTIGWSMLDNDGDLILSSLYYRQRGSKQWVKAVANWEENFYTIDTSLLSDGHYELKVVINDSPSNTLQSYGTDELIAAATMVVDRTPPLITAFTAQPGQGELVVRCTADDALSLLARAEIMTDGERWLCVTPKDGIMDSAHEEFHFSVKLSDLDDRNLFLRISDENQNHTVVSWP